MPLYALPEDKPAPKKKVRRGKKVEHPNKDDLSPVQELIWRRRHQMILHSALYYHLDQNIISDHLWQQWADELATLQDENPESCKIDYYDFEFKDWNGSTGMHLPYNGLIRDKALWLADVTERMKENYGVELGK